MEITKKETNGTLYINFEGELDENTAHFVKEKLSESVLTPEIKQEIFNLEKLEFMDSTGIGVLIGRYKKFSEKNVPIFILNPSKHVDKILKMTAIYQIMPKLN